ncbi:class F sortase [Enterococcus sp. AZ196]|uniref:class F sortase n=1 Tax=Enterococcus sp. AZ196 TaxID=2774659 RepID=UPI003D2C7B27
MKPSRRKKILLSLVIVSLLLLFGPLIFSSISNAQAEKEESYEKQVKIYGDDEITITANDSFHPKQYYKAVADDFQPVQMNYTTINTSKPGRHSLVLTAKNKKDYDKRTVWIIVEKEKKNKVAKAESKTSLNQPPASSTSEETLAEQPKQSATQESISSTETQQAPIENTQESMTQQETPQPVPEEPQPAAAPPVQQQPALQPNQISFHGQSLPYQNAGQGSGQGIINSGAIAATWGGNPTQSGTDNQNTHFIGHNPGIFSPILSLSGGDAITVTDSAGNATTYIVTGLTQVDDSGRDIASGLDNWDQITSAGGGERITLQTCLGDTVNLIVYAQA